MIAWKRLALAAVAAAVAFTPAHAAPSRDELDKRLKAAEALIARYEQRTSVLEQRLLTGDPAAVRLQSRVDQLETSLRTVTGSLEQARFQNERLREEIRTLRRELQLHGVEVGGDLLTDTLPGAGFGGAPMSLGPAGGGAGAENFGEPLEEPTSLDDVGFAGDGGFTGVTASSAAAAGSIALPNDPVAALDAARNLLIDARFAEAEQAFMQFTQQFPESPQMGEALYWQGEISYQRNAFDEAKNLYIEAIKRDPRGARAPDAMVKLASALHKMGFDGEACTTLSQFPRQYPDAGPQVRTKASRASQAAGCR
ncbi:MAG: tol-pal system protein YbgF [Caulobacterales bacterium]|nr:tol-pal system protein YbgF [Caulobacterales bacterium]